MKIAFAALALVSVVGCSASTTEPDTFASSDNLTSSSSLEECRAQAKAHNVSTVIVKVGSINFPAQQPIAGSTHCVRALDGSFEQCRVSDGLGIAEIDVPACTDVKVSWSKDDFVPSNALLRIAAEDFKITMRRLTMQQITNLAAAVGTTLDLSKSIPIITTYDPNQRPLANVSVSYPSGTRWYFQTNGVPMTSLTATTATGIMGFSNADVGAAEVTATAPGLDCKTYGGIPGATANSAKVDAEPGTIVSVMYRCAPQTP